MTAFVTTGILIFYAISLQATLTAARDPRGGSRAHASVIASGTFTFGSALLAVLLYFYEDEGGASIIKQANSLLLTVALLMVTVGLVVWVAAMIHRHKILLPMEEARHKVPLKQRLKFQLDLASPNWRNLKAPAYAKEDHRVASRSARFMLVATGVVAFPSVVLLLATTMAMNIRGSSASDFASHIVGYYTLLIATSWTVVFLITLLLVASQQTLKETRQATLNLSDVVLAVGTWAGFGAAGGVFVGALIPVVVVLIPSGPFEGLDVTLLDAITPDLLLSTSAAGAVLGFLIGEVISLVSYAANEQNLFIKIVLPPTLFGVLATVLGFIGLRPGAISSHLAHLYRVEGKYDTKVTGNPFEVAKKVDLDSSEGWSALVESFDTSGWNNAIDGYLYYWMTWVTVALVVLFAYSIAAYKRELALVKGLATAAKVDS